MRAKIFWLAGLAWLLLVANAIAFYDPGLQRWINRDPIEEEGGINLAEFASSEPVAGVDAFGLNDCPRWAEYMCEHPPSENTRKTMAVGCAIAVPVGAGSWLLPPAGAAATTAGAAKVAVAAAKAAATGTKVADTAAKAVKAEQVAAKATKQWKSLSPGEIKKLKKAGHDPHEFKPNSKFDLFKDKDGNICVKPKDGSGPGDPTGININDL